MTLRPGLFLLVLMTLAGRATAQGGGAVLRGAVHDPDTGRPVVGARVALSPWLGAWTGPDGRFAIPAPRGRYAPVVDCPRRDGPPLAAGADSVAVPAESDLILGLAHGGECLTPMSATPYAEFRGVLTSEGQVRLLRLCDGPAYRVAIDFPPAIWRNLVFKATRDDDPRKPDLALVVRGRLTGPGFYGADGSAGYLIEAEKVISFAKRATGESCR